MVTAVVLNYYQERREYLAPIIEALRSNSRPPDEIIIFNNDPDFTVSIEGVVCINSSKNFGCLSRFLIALMTNSQVFLFQDNDLVLGSDAVDTLLGKLQENPNSVVGRWGKSMVETTYSQGVDVSEGEVDVVLGRVMMCRRGALIRALAEQERHSVPIFREDDILLSLANKRAGHRNYVTQFGVRELDERGVGLSHEPQHYPERDALCKKLLA